MRDTGPGEGAVWGSDTKSYRSSQNDKLRQWEPGLSKNGIARSLQICTARKLSAPSPVASYDFSQRMAVL